MTLEETILSNPIGVALLTIGLILAVAYLRRVGPRQAIALEQLRNIVQPLAERRLKDKVRKLTRPKGLPDESEEYVASVSAGLLRVAKVLWKAGFRWNPISTKKFRILEDGSKQYAVLSVALRESVVAESQLHVYIFPSVSGEGYDLYAHREANNTDPEAHSGGKELVPGDTDGELRDALAHAGIGYEQRP